MKNKFARHFGDWLLCGTFWMLVYCLLAMTSASAQTGDNAIYTGTSTFGASPAVIDASVFSGDFCLKIYNAIVGHTAGTLIDARGITGTLTCANTPWWNGTTAIVTPTTILLPAATITISTTWYVPNFTKISGMGSSTVIAASSSFSQPTGLNYKSNAIIEMGYDYTNMSTEYNPYGGTSVALCGTPSSSGSSSDCQSVQIEHLAIDGTNYSSANGIYNNASQELSYVNDVTFTNIGGTGLIVGDVNATRNPLGPDGGHSGPYTNLIFNAGTNTVMTTACVEDGIVNWGFHGISCYANGASIVPSAAIYVNAQNSSIEDIRVDGFSDGILVGSVSGNPAGNNVIANVNGSNTHGSTGIKNVVHISNINASSVLMSDVALMAISSSTSGLKTVQDDLTNTTIPDQNVAMYVLGESTVNGGTNNWWSRITTSASVPSWAIGPNSPSGSCSSNGNLFSNTAGTVGHTLYACVNKSWVDLE